MKKVVIFAAAIAALVSGIALTILVSCSKQEAQDPNSKTNPSAHFEAGQEVTISGYPEQTKVSSEISSVSGDLEFKWEKGDLIRVTVGDKSTSFKCESIADDGKGTFKGNMPAGGTKYTVQYPYTEDGKEPDLTTQYYCTGGLPEDKMLFTSDAKGLDEEFKLKNQSSFLLLYLYGEGKTVGKIEVVKHKDETFTLDCAPGVALKESESEAIPFFIVLPEGTYNVDIRIYAPNGDIISTITSQKALTFETSGGLSVPAKEIKRQMFFIRTNTSGVKEVITSESVTLGDNTYTLPDLIGSNDATVTYGTYIEGADTLSTYYAEFTDSSDPSTFTIKNATQEGKPVIVRASASGIESAEYKLTINYPRVTSITLNPSESANVLIEGTKDITAKVTPAAAVKNVKISFSPTGYAKVKTGTAAVYDQQNGTITATIQGDQLGSTTIKFAEDVTEGISASCAINVLGYFEKATGAITNGYYMITSTSTADNKTNAFYGRDADVSDYFATTNNAKDAPIENNLIIDYNNSTYNDCLINIVDGKFKFTNKHSDADCQTGFYMAEVLNTFPKSKDPTAMTITETSSNSGEYEIMIKYDHKYIADVYKYMIFSNGAFTPSRSSSTVSLWKYKGLNSKKESQTIAFKDGTTPKELKLGDHKIGSTYENPVTGAKTEVTYTSGNENVATVDSNGKLTIKGVGTTEIIAEAKEDETHWSNSASYILTTSKSDPEFNFSPGTTTYNLGKEYSVNSTVPAQDPGFTGDTAPQTETQPTKPADIEYESSSEEIATVDKKSGVVTINKAGSVTITATSSETDNFNEGHGSYTLTFNKSDRNLAFVNQSEPEVWGLGQKYHQGGSYPIRELTSTSITEGGVTYTSTDETVAKIVDGQIQIITNTTGTTKIKATIAEEANPNYKGATAEYELKIELKEITGVSPESIVFSSTGQKYLDANNTWQSAPAQVTVSTTDSGEWSFNCDSWSKGASKEGNILKINSPDGLSTWPATKPSGSVSVSYGETSRTIGITQNRPLTVTGVNTQATKTLTYDWGYKGSVSLSIPCTSDSDLSYSTSDVPEATTVSVTFKDSKANIKLDIDSWGARKDHKGNIIVKILNSEGNSKNVTVNYSHTAWKSDVTIKVTKIN